MIMLAAAVLVSCEKPVDRDVPASAKVTASSAVSVASAAHNCRKSAWFNYGVVRSRSCREPTEKAGIKTGEMNGNRSKSGGVPILVNVNNQARQKKREIVF
ncbi:hypothetical protein E5161_16795 [Cohnella pontilimi]|uniref:Uncharacterized protein n=1 Tax=Cohnella pontilimi TaxID=2564100 RepID=A0A4U0F7W7_9BACL|nr:hypothetical protein [Cohnella pontilimi]TJY40796.1 hypothetical protein E5161_16795 [Cohnella pontilimi]